MARKRNQHENIFFKSLNGLAYGLFVSYVIGNLLITLGQYVTTWPLEAWGETFLSLSGVACGIGVAYATGAKGLVLLSAGLAGAICHSDQVCWSLIAYVAIMLAVYIGELVEGKTPIDIFLVPCITIIMSGILAYYVAPYINMGVAWLVRQMALVMHFPTWMMALLLGPLACLLQLTPLLTVAIAMALKLNALQAGVMICGGCVAMLGTAMMSIDDNDIGKVLAVGIGAGFLQFKNLIKHPQIFLPLLLSSMICSELSAVIFGLSGTAYGAGMANTSFIGPLSIASTMGSSAWLLVMIADILLPILLTYSFYRVFKKMGWIASGDLAIYSL